LQSASHRFVLCGTASLLAGLLYLNALHNPFVYDDHHTVVANPSLQDLTNVRAIALHALTRPILNLSYAVDYAVWGAGPLGFHVTNVLLHMVNVMLLFVLAWQFARSTVVAFASALLFAVHPMMTEAVGYISGRSEVLSATFFILGLICGRRWILGHGTRWAVVTILVWAAMLATKELGAMFPFVLFCYDRLVVRGSRDDMRRRLLTIHLPLMTITVVAGIIRLLVLARVEYPGQVALHWDYLLLALDVVRRYVGLIVFPSGQTIFHEVAAIHGIFDPRALVAVGLLGILAAIVWGLRQSQGLVSFGILWFLLVLVPSAVLTVLDQGEPMAEHRVYVASCGLFLAVGSATGSLTAWLATADPRLMRLARAGFALVVLSLGLQTVLRNRVWSSPVALWSESVDRAPNHYRPRLLLGEALEDEGRRDEAAAQFKTAIRLRPTDSTGHLKLGRNLAQMGQFAAARQHFLEAIAIDPANDSARQALRTLDDMESKLGIR
jgi:hypothetical protein